MWAHSRLGGGNQRTYTYIHAPPCDSLPLLIPLFLPQAEFHPELGYPTKLVLDMGTFTPGSQVLAYESYGLHIGLLGSPLLGNGGNSGGDASS